MITQERLKELFNYDPEIGLFIRKTHINRKATIGNIAGSLANGYIEIRIEGKRYKSHKLAWLYVYGIFPENDIDHIDHDKQNNKIVNLRHVTRSENSQNQSFATARNKTGFLGVSACSDSKTFKAQISINGKNTAIGRFATPEAAHKAYVEAKRIHHSTCTL